MAKKRTIAAYRHRQKASNAPTQEIAGADAGAVPDRRSPPSDRGPREPQLWWNTEEPAEGWVQPAPQLYTQEKIVPQQYIESLLLAQGKGLKQDLFFQELNGLTADQYFEPYQHQGNWLNRLIRGESSQVMASLLEHEGMAKSVQMVYFDPPYGIGFDSNFQSLTGRPGARKGAQADVETVKAFRDRYHNGLHSYLDTLHRNLVLVRELLTESGSVFIQMGSENMPEVLLVAQHVFGKESRMGLIPYATTGSSVSRGLPDTCNYLIWYATNKANATEKFNQLHEEASRQDMMDLFSWHAMIEEEDGKIRSATKEERNDVSTMKAGDKLFMRVRLSGPGKGRNEDFIWKGKAYHPTPSRETASWRVSLEGLQHLANTNRLLAGNEDAEDTQLYFKHYEDEMPGRKINNMWSDQSAMQDKHYTVETAPKIIERCMLMATQPGDLVMDITCGAGTTAFVAERWGRRWITTDTSAVPIALTRQRIATATHPYQLLQDSEAGAEKERELGGIPIDTQNSLDPAKGFVYKRSKKVTAAILAYGQEAETVLLVNQPEIDRSKIRVSAPFCVQNANATAFLPLSDRFDTLDNDSHRSEAQLTLERLENALMTSGIKYPNGAAGKRVRVQNLRTYGERVELDDATESDGIRRGYITHTADITVPNGNDNTGESSDFRLERAALAIVGFHRRVASTFTNYAVAEANNMPGIKHLIVIGFEFESAVQRGERKRGMLNVVQVQANTDLAINELEHGKGDEAFVMLGEPELIISQTKNGKYVIEVKGFMTHDPASGAMRSAGPKDIHCWMLDSDYDRRSFMCRELHFMNGEDKQLRRLRSALEGVLNERSWASMVSTKSDPFDPPSNEEHLIAVRIVTTAGVELTAIRDVVRVNHGKT